MNIDIFLNKLFAKATEAGFSACEAYYSEGDSLEVAVFNGEIDDYSVSTSCGLSFRGLKKGKMGYASTQVMDEDAIDLLVNGASSNAEIIEDEDEQFIFEGSKEYVKLNTFNSELENVPTSDKIQLAMDMEKLAKAADTRVTSLQYSLVATGRGKTRIVNSRGLDVSDESNMVAAIVMPVVEENGDVNSAAVIRSGRDFAALNANSIAVEAVKEATSLLGGKPISSGKYKAIFRNDVAASFLSTFSGIFSAERAQKGMSLLKGREGAQIASDILTIKDNPHLEGGLASASFDAEGVATLPKDVVAKGFLTTLLHNLKTASKQGVITTGNASKASVSAPVDVAPSNFYIAKGQKTLDELISTLDNGILITDVMGLHAGANPISGDFSLGAKGFEVKDGVVLAPVAQITVAGNFFKLLESIIEIGSDLYFDMASHGSCFGSPSIVISEISIAGK